MSTIKNILIPTDFSETANLAVAHGTYMGQLFNAKIYLLHSIQETIHLGTPGEPSIVQDGENLALEQLKKAAEEIKKKYEVEITTLVVGGKPAASITEAAKEHNIDVIVMGTYGASGFEEFFVGSNADKVVTLAPCPVITIRVASKNVGFSNIIMPITNALHSRQKVDNVIEIASKYNATVHIMGLLEASDSTEENKFEIKLESVENLFKKDNIKYTKRIIKGHNLAIEVMKFCDEVGGDLIVIMTGHETDTGIFLGTVAKQVVNHSKIPVMSIRPAETMIETFDPAGGTGTI